MMEVTATVSGVGWSGKISQEGLISRRARAGQPWNGWGKSTPEREQRSSARSPSRNGRECSRSQKKPSFAREKGVRSKVPRTGGLE